MVSSQQDFDSLNIRQIRDDVVINFGGGDKLIIEDMLKTDITYSDFV